MKRLLENSGFIAIGVAGVLAWAAIAWTIHRTSKVLAPPCRRCANGFHRNNRDGKIDPKGDRHWITGWDGELRIEDCANTSTPINCRCHCCWPKSQVVR